MFIVPTHRFNPKQVTAAPAPQVESGGVNLNDDESIIQTDGGGRWAISYSGIDLRSPASLRLWESWASYLSGGARAVLVPLLSLATAPRPMAGLGLARPSRLLADDEAFPTSVGYAAPYIKATSVGAAALRATVLTIDVAQGSRIQGGEKFSVGRRAYLIERVTAREGQQATCVISPPLRQAIAAGAALNFEWPLVQCRAVSGQSLAPDVSFGRSSAVAISFVEDFGDAE